MQVTIQSNDNHYIPEWEISCIGKQTIDEQQLIQPENNENIQQIESSRQLEDKNAKCTLIESSLEKLLINPSLLTNHEAKENGNNQQENQIQQNQLDQSQDQVSSNIVKRSEGNNVEVHNEFILSYSTKINESESNELEPIVTKIFEFQNLTAEQQKQIKIVLLEMDVSFQLRSNINIK
ncbi:Hypothetical_protein [Hexamita inflata]|uniref:Hypothetical_protein n=1 Tax=Hexamita inflata TaxID=28002 RepID=A0AA86QMY0_9EUKA|nr:Hypothetical protein HINF_LOCUS43629 [Hexamita inflata]